MTLSSTLTRPVLIQLALCGAGLAAAADRPACDRPLSLALHDHGLLYSTQSGEGIDKDVADELIRRSGCRFSVTVMPRARIWQLVESGALDFSLSGISNPAREQFAGFAWYFSDRFNLLVRKDAGVRRLADFQTNQRLKLGVIRGFRYSATANRLLDQLESESRVTYSTSLEPLYQILLADRVQALIVEPFDYPAIESAKLREQAEVVELDDPPVPHGLIMSKKALSAQQQQAWRSLVDDMLADGTVRRIFEKYFPAKQARELTEF